MLRRYLFAGLLLAWGAPTPLAYAEPPVAVFAAASLKGALGEINDAWAKQGHPKLRIDLDSSGALAKQIQQGAPAAIFVSADEKWMDYLARQKMLAASSRVDLLTNTLVLVVPADKPVKLTLKAGFDLSRLLGKSGRLSVGDTKTVPAGIYAKQALSKLGVWNFAEPRLAPAANVKAALLAVEQGEAPAAIVYGTDAKGDAKVAVAGVFPADSHEPIHYPVALIAKQGETDPARAALAFLTGAQAKAIYAKYGFGTK